jgi:dihydrofolate reductase
MGKVVVSELLSVDGCAEGPGGDFLVMPLSEAFNEHNAERIATAGRLLYGGTTYRQMVGYWPTVLGEAGHSAAEQQIAQRFAEGLPVVAVSDTLTADETGPWRDQTSIVGRADAHREVAALRDLDGETLVFGSQSLWGDLMAHGLVDELHLMVGPRIVAGDRPAFAGVPATDLRLLGVKEYAEVGTVVLHYAVER